MKDLQKNFEEFKTKTYHQLKGLKKEKEELNKNLVFYKEAYSKLLNDFEENERRNKDTMKKIKGKYDDVKGSMINTEILKTMLDESQKEVSYLKLQINKLEMSERKLHNLLMEKERLNTQEKESRNSGEFKNGENLDFKLSNMFSPVHHEVYNSNNDKIIEENKNKHNAGNKDSVDFDSNILKIKDLKKVHERFLDEVQCDNRSIKTHYETENLHLHPKEDVLEYNLSKRGSIKSKYYQSNNSELLATKKMHDEKTKSSTNVSHFDKNELSKLTAQQNASSTFSVKHNTKSSISPIRVSNYHSNVSSTTNIFNTSRAKRNSISKNEN